MRAADARAAARYFSSGIRTSVPVRRREPKVLPSLPVLRQGLPAPFRRHRRGTGVTGSPNWRRTVGRIEPERMHGGRPFGLYYTPHPVPAGASRPKLHRTPDRMEAMTAGG